MNLEFTPCKCGAFTWKTCKCPPVDAKPMTADIETLAGRIFTMAVSWSQGEKPWDEELVVRLIQQAYAKGFADAREKAAKVVKNDCYASVILVSKNCPFCLLAEQIRALTLGEVASKCGCEENHKMHPKPGEGAK